MKCNNHPTRKCVIAKHYEQGALMLDYYNRYRRLNKGILIMLITSS